jgi:alkanesulfonate monooxygenase SsuD/methylene tetrahydromethanopterin reductase-like flavin-dependent oxidoreductase (luciferase family)
MDIVSKKLAEVLGVDDDINGEDAIKQNPLTKQPVYSSSLVTEADVAAFRAVEEQLGLEDFSKIVLMKTAQKAMNDHDELIEIMAKVDDSKAARMAEVAVSALASASDAAKALMNFTLQKERMEIEKQKLEIKSVTINNVGIGDNTAFTGTQKEILDRIKNMMDTPDDDVPPLVDA